MRQTARVGINKWNGDDDFAEKLHNSYNEGFMEFLNNVCITVFCPLIFFGLYFLATFHLNSNSWCRFCDQIKFFETIFLGLVSIFGKHQ